MGRQDRRRYLAFLRVMFAVIAINSNAEARPPSWWPWDQWIPGSGYLPVTRSPRVLAGTPG